MEKVVDCRELCKKTVQKDQAAFINARIKENYMVNWLVDGLPVGNVIPRENGVDEYTIGFPLGQDQGTGEPILNNHYDIRIDYHHNQDKKSYRVVGIEVVAERYFPFLFFYFLLFLPGHSGGKANALASMIEGRKGRNAHFLFWLYRKKNQGRKRALPTSREHSRP